MAESEREGKMAERVRVGDRLGGGGGGRWQRQREMGERSISLPAAF